eukprot:403332479
MITTLRIQMKPKYNNKQQQKLQITNTLRTVIENIINPKNQAIKSLVILEDYPRNLKMINNNIEITNNITSGDSLIIPVKSSVSRSSSHRRSFNLIQKFQIHPLLTNVSEDGQFLDIKITNQPTVKTSRRGSNRRFSKMITEDMNTPKRNFSKFKPKDTELEEFAPLDYGNLSDFDLDSPNPLDKRNRSRPPPPINLNQLYVSDMPHHTNRRNSQRNRKSSQILVNQSSQENNQNSDKVVIVDILDQSHRPSSLINQKRNSIKDPQHHQIIQQDTRKMQINIDQLDNYQTNIANDGASVQSSVRGIPRHDDDENNFPNTTRNLLGEYSHDRQADTQDKLIDHPFQTEEKLLKTDKGDTPGRSNKVFEFNVVQENQKHDLNQVSVESHDIKEDDKADQTKVQNNQKSPSNVSSAIKRSESKLSSGTDRSIHEKSLKNQRVFDDICADDAERLRSLKKYDYFIILPDDSFKQKWDFIITVNLLITAIMTPYRIAFYDLDDVTWIVIDSVVDFLFGVDMILCFFMAYYDVGEDIVDNRKKIATSYLKSWFLVDLFSIIPISQILNTGDFSSLARIARLPKLYRLVKVFRLVRLMKVVKERNTLIKQVNDIFKISVGFERLIFFIIMSVAICHICGCFWVILAKIDDARFQTWIFRYGYQDSSNVEVYIASMYFTLTTITTVGFGDIVGVSIEERVMCIVLMIIGVFSFSFSISSLSSMLSSIDTRNANLNEKLSTLNKIQKQYQIGFEFYRRLKQALKYDYQRNAAVQFGFLNELPQNLKIELSLIMHKEIVKKIFFFQKKPPHFIAFIGPLLKPLHIEEGNYIYKEKDPIEEIFFLIKGKAALVHKDIKDSAYMIIDQGYFFGEIDFVFQNNDGKRKFTAKALDNCHLLTINKADLAKVDVEYEEILADLFMNAQKRLRRTLKIKDESESYFLKKQIQNSHRPSFTTIKDDDRQIRRMSTALKIGQRKKKVLRQVSQTGTENKQEGDSINKSSENNNSLEEGIEHSKDHEQHGSGNQLKQINEEDVEEDEEEEEDEDEEEEVSDNIKTDSSFLEKEKKVEEKRELEEQKTYSEYQLGTNRKKNDKLQDENEDNDNEDNNNEEQKEQSSDSSKVSSFLSQNSSKSEQGSKNQQSNKGKVGGQERHKNLQVYVSKNKPHLVLQEENGESPYPRGSLKSSSIQSNDNSEVDFTAKNKIQESNSSKMRQFSLLNSLRLTKKQTSSPSPKRLSEIFGIQKQTANENQTDQKFADIQRKRKMLARNQTSVNLNQVKRESSITKHQAQRNREDFEEKQQKLKERKKTKNQKKFTLMRSMTNFKDDKPVIVLNKKYVNKESQQHISNFHSNQQSNVDLQQLIAQSPNDNTMLQQTRAPSEVAKSIEKDKTSSQKRKTLVGRNSTLSAAMLQKSELEQDVKNQPALKNQITIHNLNPVSRNFENAPTITLLPEAKNSNQNLQNDGSNMTEKNQAKFLEKLIAINEENSQSCYIGESSEKSSDEWHLRQQQQTPSGKKRVQGDVWEYGWTDNQVGGQCGQNREITIDITGALTANQRTLNQKQQFIEQFEFDITEQQQYQFQQWECSQCRGVSKQLARSYAYDYGCNQ